VDEAARDKLRRALSSEPPIGPGDSAWPAFRGDLDLVGQTLTPLVAGLGDEARCVRAKAYGHVRVARLAVLAAKASEDHDLEDMEASEVGEEDPGGADMGEVATAVQDAERGWSGNVRGVMTRLSRMRDSGGRLHEDWGELSMQLAAIRNSCGWDAN